MKSFAFEFKMVKFDEIHPDSKNIRTKHIPDEDHALKQSILANGLIQPFIVCNNPDGSGYLIIDGHRTFDACREIFKDSNPEVPVVVSSQEDGEFTESQLRKARLLRDIHTQKLGDWDQLVAIKLHTDDMREEHSGITDTEIAKTLGRTKSWLSKKLTAGNSGIFAPAIEMGKVSYGKSLIIKSAPVEAQKALIDATKDFTLHDTERIVKQVSMGVSVAEAIRTVELSKSEIPQGTEEDALTVHDGEGETTTEEAVEKDDDSGRKSLQPSSPETTGIVAQTLGIEEKGIEEAEPLAVAQSSLPEGGTDSHTPDVDPPTESKKKEKISPSAQILDDLDKTYKRLEITQKHIKQNGFESPKTKAGRKALGDRLFSLQREVESVAEKLLEDGSEEKGSWGFCRLTRVTHPLKDFDFHAIGPKDCPDARSMIIQTQKNLTKGLNIVDNIAKRGS